MSEAIQSATQWPCPFDAGELAVLRKFRQICEDISICRFIRDLPKHENKFTIESLPDGTCRSTYPNYDKDDFLAYLTHLRKLVAQGESTNLYKVMAIIGKSATDDERAALKEIRKMLNEEANAPALQLSIGTEGNETTYTPKQIEDILFNGQVFHTDDSLQGDLRKIQDFDPLTKMAFLRYATIFSRQAWQISCVLKNRGYL
jgi:pyoverdine/dityrosine biosynthesis protein Dit1